MMNLQMDIGSARFTVLHHHPIHLSIPLIFNGKQPNSYDVDRATAKPYQAGEFIGSVAQGGDCNFEQYTLVPHCNGTHTECIGHISKDSVAVHSNIQDTLIPATLITVTPVLALSSKDTYNLAFENDDMIITADMIASALGDTPKEFLPALVIRTLPNGGNKKSREYLKELPPFFSTEAMQLIYKRGINHLLVDIPSVDRTFDEGKLGNHRIYWNIAAGINDIDTTKLHPKSITEMIYIEDAAVDGNYLLNLQMAPFMADASPSRPILYPLRKIIE